MSLLSHIKLFFAYIKFTLASAMEYRTSFIIQATSMIVNDLIWILFWTLFFGKFNTVNGWTLNDMLLLYAVLTFSFGCMAFLFGNRGRIATIIAEGRLDFYLALPKNELFHMLITRNSWFAFGDIIFGLALAVIFLSPSKWLLFLLLSFFSASIFLSFAIIVGSLAFVWGNADHASRSLFFGLMSFGSYPITAFKGFAKFLLLTLLPAGFISGVPVQLLNSFSWYWFIMLILFSIFMFLTAIWIFYRGLKKYESGNMITVRL